MNIRYIGPQKTRTIAATGQQVTRGELVDVAADLARSLLTQSVWEPAGEDPDAVPAGDVATVLTWVGDDPARARRALEAEQARSRPRKGVLGPLEVLVDGDGEVPTDPGNEQE